MSPTPSVNSERNFQHGDAGGLGKERKTKKRDRGDASDGSNQRQRRHSIANAARDPGDEPDSRGSREESGPGGEETRSPSLMTDFDGLIRPGTSCNSVRPPFLCYKDSYILF
jgi:GTP cyclohydrolase I